MAELPVAEYVVPTPNASMFRLQNKQQGSLSEMVFHLPVFNSVFVAGLSCSLFVLSQSQWIQLVVGQRVLEVMWRQPTLG